MSVVKSASISNLVVFLYAIAYTLSQLHTKFKSWHVFVLLVSSQKHRARTKKKYIASTAKAAKLTPPLGRAMMEE